MAAGIIPRLVPWCRCCHFNPGPSCRPIVVDRVDLKLQPYLTRSAVAHAAEVPAASLCALVRL